MTTGPIDPDEQGPPIAPWSRDIEDYGAIPDHENISTYRQMAYDIHSDRSPQVTLAQARKAAEVAGAAFGIPIPAVYFRDDLGGPEGMYDFRINAIYMRKAKPEELGEGGIQTQNVLMHELSHALCWHKAKVLGHGVLFLAANSVIHSHRGEMFP